MLLRGVGVVAALIVSTGVWAGLATLTHSRHSRASCLRCLQTAKWTERLEEGKFAGGDL